MRRCFLRFIKTFLLLIKIVVVGVTLIVIADFSIKNPFKQLFLITHFPGISKRSQSFMPAKNAIVEYLSTHSETTIDTGFLAYLANLTQVAKNRAEYCKLDCEGAGGTTHQSQAYRQRKLLLARHTVRHGQPAHRQIRRRVSVPPFFTPGATISTRLNPMPRNRHASSSVASMRTSSRIAARTQTSSPTGRSFPPGWKPRRSNLWEKQTRQRSHERHGNTIRQKLGNQRLLGLDYYSGGHLTHATGHNISAQMFDAYTYSVDRTTGLLDYDQIEKWRSTSSRSFLLTGYSAYPRKSISRACAKLPTRSERYSWLTWPISPALSPAGSSKAVSSRPLRACRDHHYP